MIKKIILIFILFVLSLFSQVEIEDDTLYVRTSEDKDKISHWSVKR